MTPESALRMKIDKATDEDLPVWVPPSAHGWGCDTCGARIDGEDNRSVRRYCSNKCRQKAYRERTGRR